MIATAITGDDTDTRIWLAEIKYMCWQHARLWALDVLFHQPAHAIERKVRTAVAVDETPGTRNGERTIWHENVRIEA